MTHDRAGSRRRRSRLGTALLPWGVAWRALAFSLITALGVASLVATSAPPPMTFQVVVEPSVVCIGEEVEVSWSRAPVSQRNSTPYDFGLRSAPPEGTDPPLGQVPAGGPSGSGSVTALRSTYVGVGSAAVRIVAAELGRLSVLPCGETARQWPGSEAPGLTALAVAETDGGLLVALGDGDDAGGTRLQRLDANLATVWEQEVAGTVSTLVALGDDGWAAVGGDLVQALAADGTVLWTRTLPMSLPEATRITARDATADGEGGLLVAGSWFEPNAGFRAFLHRYDADGEPLWQLQPGLPMSDTRIGRSVVLDADGTVFLGGAARRPRDGAATDVWDAFVLAYELDGTPLPERGLRQPGDADSGQLALGADGGLLLLAATTLLALDADGNEAWRYPMAEGERVVGFLSQPDGRVFVAGEVDVEVQLPHGRSWWGDDGLNHRDLHLRHLEADGTVGWERWVGSLADDRARAVAAWPQAGPASVLLGGTTAGDLIQPLEDEAAAFVWRIDE